MTPINIEAAKALLARVEVAKGGDQELDAAIVAALMAPARSFVRQSPINGAWCIFTGEKDRSGRDRLWEGRLPWNNEETRRVTSSIDSVVALVDYVCRTNSLAIRMDPSGNGAELTWWPEGLAGAVEITREGVAESVCQAVLIALFGVLIAHAEMATCVAVGHAP